MEKALNRKQAVEARASRTASFFKSVEHEKDFQSKLPVRQQNQIEQSLVIPATSEENTDLLVLLPLQQQADKREEQLICTYCGMCFTGLPEFLEHEHISNRPFKTSKSTSVSGQYERIATQTSDPSVQKLLVTRKKIYNCIVCGDTFRGLSHLLLHQKVHKGHKLFSPRDCKKVLPEQSRFSYSQCCPIPEDIFTCTLCGLTFNYQSSLTRHYGIHLRQKGPENSDSEKNHASCQQKQSGKTSFICTTCGKSLSSRASFTSHKQIHIRNRFFRCPDCGKHFTTRSTVKRHRRIHTGERPYICKECGKCFNQTSSLKTHQKRHAVKRAVGSTEHVF
ncbi:oocyte zinc finger protein XlCOF26-like [Protopterus annectens]|uniref:oocyte zinc finger protein XlCOF26-like n=1 Tax=Protopterus annectens TaxID=7888 RepID=UPI001CFB87F5|nr:oocyte zinc finger protein XlCOF26-like [Protopterus annectens]XP_043931826.1 oocyte zinc finger protein XlCOF26-like [Protopterus annectens]XP_043931827.1 oocyte zinc finger protein XlCOF26-like [Protopterus annectens]